MKIAATELAHALARYELTGDHEWDSHRMDPNADCPACAAHRILVGVPANVGADAALSWLYKMAAHLSSKRAWQLDCSEVECDC